MSCLHIATLHSLFILTEFVVKARNPIWTDRQLHPISASPVRLNFVDVEGKAECEHPESED